MNEKSTVLSAAKREKIGSRYCQRDRAQGKIPAVVYGKGSDPVTVTIDGHEATRHINKGEKIFRINLPGVLDNQVVLLKELQFDHLGTNIVHADFAKVSLTDRVRTMVPVHLIGEAVGLKQAGAILMHPNTEVEVECVVTEIPDFLEVNVAELDVGHAITTSDLKLPSAGMKVLTDKHSILAQIVIQQEIVVGEATAVDATAGPEVITAKKPEEGEAGAAAGKDAKGAAAKPAAGAKDAKAPAAGAKAPAAGAKPAAGGDKKK